MSSCDHYTLPRYSVSEARQLLYLSSNEDVFYLIKELDLETEPYIFISSCHQELILSMLCIKIIEAILDYRLGHPSEDAKLYKCSKDREFNLTPRPLEDKEEILKIIESIQS